MLFVKKKIYIYICCSLITSCIEVYRNKNGLLDSIVGGSLTGAIFRLNYGFRGMISGGVIGK